MFFTRISLLLFFFSLHITVKSIEVSEIYDIEAIKNFVDKLENKVKNNYNLTNATSSDEETYKILKVIFSDMTDVLKTLNRIHHDPHNNYWIVAMNNVMELFDDNEVKSGISRWSTSLYDYFAIIDVKRDIIDTYVRGILYLQEHNYLTSMKNPCFYLPTVLNFFDATNNPESIIDVYENFLSSILISLYYGEDWLYVCGERIAITKEFYEYYRLVTTSYLKIWTVNYFTGILRAYCEHNSPKVFMENAKNTLIKKLTITMRLNKKISIESKKQYMYQCDGQVVNDVHFMEYQLNKTTYYELEKMMQVVIVNEKDVSSSGDCSFDCDLIKLENLNENVCKDFKECQYITKSFDICEPEKNDSRNYQWFKDSNGVVYGPGQNELCPNTVKSLSSYYQASTMYFCDYCVCICQRHPEDKPNVVTVFSFRDQISNIKENKVVVGVRFVKKDNMIHVQIKEAELDSNLKDEGFSVWKELENFYYDKYLDQYVLIVNSIKGSLSLGLDYGHPERMNIDDLIAPSGFVITGVRFRYAGDSFHSPHVKFGAVELQTRVSAYDVIEKKISNDPLTHWISPKKQDKRDELKLYEPDNPTKSIENNIDSKPGQFVRFQASDLKKDAGQSTVPFFDALPAEGTPEFPLEGIGIIHKGSKGSGGYLAFRIFDLDFSQDFKVPLESESIFSSKK
ncbi:uncharacterized protein LOC123261054 isoform X2 [Cotesia glomerata]|uniref:uncharacterized protein LOC123261054 isoform X2 n=1 Tax=Cotesia glomerata TaxID=32391 RepID=UPI001D007F3A|nr:uncharacterized protein LOC123261054 isoform X2 [Cotesia glomerata]